MIMTKPKESAVQIKKPRQISEILVLKSKNLLIGLNFRINEVQVRWYHSLR